MYFIICFARVNESQTGTNDVLQNPHVIKRRNHVFKTKEFYTLLSTVKYKRYVWNNNKSWFY